MFISKARLERLETLERRVKALEGAQSTERIRKLERAVDGRDDMIVLFPTPGLIERVERIAKELDRHGNDLHELIDAAGYEIQTTTPGRTVVKKSPAKKKRA